MVQSYVQETATERTFPAAAVGSTSEVMAMMTINGGARLAARPGVLNSGVVAATCAPVVGGDLSMESPQARVPTQKLSLYCPSPTKPKPLFVSPSARMEASTMKHA